MGSLYKRFQVRISVRIKFVQSYRHFYDRSNKRAGINNSSPSCLSQLLCWLSGFSSLQLLEATIFLALIQAQTHPDELSAHTNRRATFYLFSSILIQNLHTVPHTHTHFLNGRSAKALDYCAIRCYSRDIIVWLIAQTEIKLLLSPAEKRVEPRICWSTLAHTLLLNGLR